MTSENDRRRIVLASIEDADRIRCVDLFIRHDGSFGFEEFRRDAEDNGRWTSMGRWSTLVYSSEDALRLAAAEYVPWFADAGGKSGTL